MNRSRALVVFVVALSCALTSACTGRYANHRYGPPTDSIVLQASPDGERLGSVLVRCLGITEAGERPAALFRLRVESSAQEPLEIDLAAAKLLDLGFTEFAPARLSGEGPGGRGQRIVVSPGEAQTFELAFPFPADRPVLDLDGLILGWALTLGTRTFDVSSSFDRIYPQIDDRWGRYDGFGYDRGYVWGLGLGLGVGLGGRSVYCWP